jgi:hypothetical protein
VGSTSIVLLALEVASAGAASAAGALHVLAVGLGLYARHWLLLADRSRIGTRSRGEAGGTLTPWPSRRPGVAFAIETKTRSYDGRHLARVREQAVWLSRRRRRWFRRGALPVVCLVRAGGLERVEQNVLVVSIDRLLPALRSCAGRPVADELGIRRASRPPRAFA